MHKLISKLAIIILILANFVPTIALAQETTAFNPNYLVSDEEMQNYQAMNQDDIQAFLDDHGGYIAKLRTADVSSTIRQASDIIYRAAQQYKINPKYLLVKLQKEQSLITEDIPTQKQLDWATGYAVCDSCSMDDPSIQNHKGFGVQVDCAAGIMRWYYDFTNQYDWIKKANNVYQIDNTSVRPVNNATAFLYTYTPHIQGNQNFWTIWEKWFSQFYPDGSLLKTTDNSTVYLIQNGNRRPFKTQTALISRYDPKLIITVPASEIVRYPEAKPITFSNYSILKQDNNYYLLDYDTLRPFANTETVRALGYNPEEMIEVSQTDIAGYPQGTTITSDNPTPIGEAVRTKAGNQLYFIKDNVAHLVYDEKIIRIDYPSLAIKTIADADLLKYSEGDPLLFKDGTLMGLLNTPFIYVIENGKKRHITSEAVFTGLGYKKENVIWVNQIAGPIHETGQAIYYQKPATTEGIAEAGTSNDKMIRTPIEKTTYAGDKFDTNIDAYLIADYDTGKVLTAKNADVVRPMASLTKAMTAYQVVKSGINLNKIITYDPKKHYSDYNNYRLAKGEMVRVKYLLDALLVSSLNTPAVMSVDANGQKMTAFVKGMNNKVKEWGLKKTTFADSSGVEVKNQTTARDYLKIFTNVLKNETVKTYLAKKSYTYKENLDKDGKPNHTDNNSNLLMNQGGLPFKILASKTGYLDEAGANLAMLVERLSDKKKFIIITMGNPDYNNRFVAPRELTSWVMEKY
jgi:D-alanyl-D-alanine endopeptidase (penicillin-binding protein 7)